MTWTYTFFRHDSHGMPWPCQDSACSAKRSVYRLVAEDGDKTGARNLCVQHSAAAALLLGISFPPIDSKESHR